jgi:hypothetical protein
MFEPQDRSYIESFNEGVDRDGAISNHCVVFISRPEQRCMPGERTLAEIVETSVHEQVRRFCVGTLRNPLSPGRTRSETDSISSIEPDR